MFQIKLRKKEVSVGHFVGFLWCRIGEWSYYVCNF